MSTRARALRAVAIVVASLAVAVAAAVACIAVTVIYVGALVQFLVFVIEVMSRAA